MSRQLLILDLDETLIYAIDTPLPQAEAFRAGPYFVYKRPHASEFIAECARHFDLAVWTTSTPAYAALIVGRLFPPELRLRFVWARDRCATRVDPQTQVKSWVKDLRKVKRLGYPLDRIIVVDDTPGKLAYDRSNLIPVSAWVGEPADRELLDLSRFVTRLLWVVNIRRVDKQTWRDQILADGP